MPIQRVFQRDPLLLMFAATVPAILLIVLSVFLDLHIYEAAAGQGASERGYLAAVNWSVNYTLLLPLTLFFVAQARQTVPKVVTRLVRTGMIRDAEGKPLADATRVIGLFDRKLDRASPVLFIVLMGAVSWTAYEWWTDSAGPLFQLRTAVEDDWQVKALSDASVSALANASFSAAAFLLQAVATVIIFELVLVAWAFATVIDHLPAADLRLRPNLRSQDSRRGFEVFEPFTVNILLASSVAYGMFYLTRLWNAYLHASPPAPDLASFVVLSIIDGIQGQGFTGGLARTLEVGHFGVSGGVVSFAALMLFVWVFLFVANILRNTAKDARDWLADAIEQEPAEPMLETLSREEALERLGSMKFWPVHYPRPNHLFALIVFAIFSMVFFRVGIVYLGMVTAASLVYVNRMVREVGGE